MKKYPLIDLKREYSLIKPKIDLKLQKLISENNFIMGSEVYSFEEKFSSFCGAKYCIGVSSGTSALSIALQSLGVGKGDEVITVSLTFAATAEAIVHVGAKPVFVDVDPETFLIDILELENAITQKTKCIIPVHLYGLPCNMYEINKIAKKHNCFVLEDASQSQGSTYKGKFTGTLADVASFSFMPAKNLGAYGDAGGITTNFKKIDSIARMLRNHGRVDKYSHDIIGYNERLDALQAGVLNVKLPFLKQWNIQRQKIAKIYSQEISDEFMSQKIPLDRTSCYYVYCLKLKSGSSVINRDLLQKELSKKGISTGVYYPIPLHNQNAFKYLKYKPHDLPVTEEMSRKSFAIPMHPFLKSEEAVWIARILNQLVVNKK